MTPKIHTLFPTTAIQYDLNRNLTQEEFATVLTHKDQCHKNVGNYSSNDNYILDNELPDIRMFIETSLKNYVDTVFDPEGDVEFYITQSWLNFTYPNQFHHSHAHQNSILSGVFYFCASAQDSIRFFSDEYSAIKIYPKNWNAYNSTSYYIQCKVGSLIIFPSSTIHSVDVKQSSIDRISLAFNTFVRGSIGSDKTLTGLSLK